MTSDSTLVHLADSAFQGLLDAHAIVKYTLSKVQSPNMAKTFPGF
jgi:hypothetical protein